MADDLVMMPGRNGGSLRVGGPGRPPSQVVVAIRESRYQLKKCLDRLVEIRDDPKSSTDDVIKACLAIARMSGIDKEKPRPRRRSTFSVVTATPAEQAAKVAVSAGAATAGIASS
jgi:hypothetical protein